MYSGELGLIVWFVALWWTQQESILGQENFGIFKLTSSLILLFHVSLRIYRQHHRGQS